MKNELETCLRRTEQLAVPVGHRYLFIFLQLSGSPADDLRAFVGHLDQDKVVRIVEAFRGRLEGDEREHLPIVRPFRRLHEPPALRALDLLRDACEAALALHALHVVVTASGEELTDAGS